GEPRSMAPRAERAGFGESRGMAPGFTHSDSTGEVFRISSPLDGDRYEIPVDVDPRYATIGLRADGGSAAAVRWLVDGVEVHGQRWQLAPGMHVIHASTAAGETDEVRIIVR
ncbi:MAG: hypothetical protein ACRD08_07215, partial [Acidimicrobiales bacterium]